MKVKTNISGIAAFTDMVDVKFYLTKAQFEGLGIDIGAKPGALGHVRLGSFEWDAWRDGDPETFPRVFGAVDFEVDGAEFVKSTDVLKDGFYRLLGFRPVGPATGKALYPEFERLPKPRKAAASTKPESPAGF